MIEHVIIKCKECSKIIEQCRCPAKDKTVRWQLCADCLSKDPRTLKL